MIQGGGNMLLNLHVPFGKPKVNDGRRILAAGDQALVVEFGNTIDEKLNKKVQLLNRKIEGAGVKGIVETVPTFRSLLVTYDPSAVGFEKLKKILEGIPADDSTEEKEERRVIEIPVCYGGEFGEDLPAVAAHTGLTEEEVIEIHSSREYNIYMLGFLPGFPYLGGLDKRLHTPRLQNPRTRIPAGSVGIGGEQTGVYPLDSPGGWRLIGRTPLKLYDPDREEPFLYQSGDYIRFVPITREEYSVLSSGYMEKRQE